MLISYIGADGTAAVQLFMRLCLLTKLCINGEKKLAINLKNKVNLDIFC